MVDNKYTVVKATNILDLKEIYEERNGSFKKMYEEWLSSGYTCYIVKIENETAGIIWLMNTDSVPLEFNYKQKLNKKFEATLNDAYVLKAYRGKGIYKEIWHSALSEAKRLNITNLYGTNLKNNILSLKVHYSLGMKNVYQILYYFRILWFNIYKIKYFNPPIDLLELRKDIKFSH